MNPVSAWQKAVLENYANFGGRSRRSEYWHFFLANFIASIAFLILSEVSNLFALISLLYWVGLIVPGLAVAVRRLHDIGKSGWWALISFIPLVGIFLIIAWMCTDSHRGTNQWGVSEKYPA